MSPQDPMATRAAIHLPAALPDKINGPASQLSALLQAGDSSNQAPSGPSSTPTFAALVRALRRRLLLALTLALSAAALTVAGVFIVLPPQYVAHLRFRVAAKSDDSPISPNTGDDSEFAVLKATQQALVVSPVVLAEALKERLPNGKEVRDLDVVRSKGVAAVDWLERAIKTDYQAGPEYLRVSLGGEDPEEVAALLNAVGRAFLKANADASRAKREERLIDYREKRERMEDEHRRLLAQLNHKLLNRELKDRDQMTQRQAQLMSDLSAAKAALRGVQGRRDEIQTEIAGLKTKLADLPTFGIPSEKMDEALKNDPIGSGYVKQLQDIAAEIRFIDERLVNPEAAKRKAIERERDARQKLAQRREQIRPTAEATYREQAEEETRHALTVANSRRAALAAQERTLNQEIEALTAQVGDFELGRAVKPLEVQVLEEKIENSKAALDEITRKISIYAFEAPRPRVTLLQEATPPNDKDYSRQLKLAGSGGMGIFFLVLFGVAFLEGRSGKISVADDVAQGLRMPVVGSLPAMPSKRRSLLRRGSNDQALWLNKLSESIDAVRTLLVHNSRSESMHVIMVTSADSGEGKTTLASQLAASLSRAWKRTLLIDGDLRHPAAHKLFEVPGEPGFSEVLRGELSATDAIRATAHSRLWVLPAGNWDAHALQALAQDNVRTLFEELKGQYDFIIVDSPPVLPVADSLLLGQHVDGVLFSILRDVSRAPAVYAAQQKLQPLGIRTLGAVMIGAEAELGRGEYRYLNNDVASVQ